MNALAIINIRATKQSTTQFWVCFMWYIENNVCTRVRTVSALARALFWYFLSYETTRKVNTKITLAICRYIPSEVSMCFTIRNGYRMLLSTMNAIVHNKFNCMINCAGESVCDGFVFDSGSRTCLLYDDSSGTQHVTLIPHSSKDTPTSEFFVGSILLIIYLFAFISIMLFLNLNMIYTYIFEHYDEFVTYFYVLYPIPKKYITWYALTLMYHIYVICISLCLQRFELWHVHSPIVIVPSLAMYLDFLSLYTDWHLPHRWWQWPRDKGNLAKPGNSERWRMCLLFSEL